MSTYYKILGLDRQPCHGGTGQWPEPGEWRVESGPLRLFQRGTLHLCQVQHLPIWLHYPGEVWEAEADGKVTVGKYNVGVLRARLTRRVGTLTTALLARWAADCAKRAYDSTYNHDYTVRSIATAASYAARDASAALDACHPHAVAYSAVRAGDRAAEAAGVARGAAFEERLWQGERLLELIRERTGDA